MVRLNTRRVDRTNNYTPILYDREIDEYAQAVLREYKPSLLREPGAVNTQHFLESYCRMRIFYYDIYNEDSERPILAMTVFKRRNIKIFDKENECVREVSVPARSVIIDNYVLGPDRESLKRFSCGHEGGHITMQWHVYTGETFDGDPYDPDYDWDGVEPYVCCSRENIESTGQSESKIRTAKEWREHHADYFSGAFTMPNATFKPFVTNLMREHGYYKGPITLGRDNDWDLLADDILPFEISEVYGVSKRAARIKLRTSGFVTGTMD